MKCLALLLNYSNISPLLKDVASIAYQDIIYKLKLKVVLTLFFIFSDNA